MSPTTQRRVGGAAMVGLGRGSPIQGSGVEHGAGPAGEVERGGGTDMGSFVGLDPERGAGTVLVLGVAAVVLLLGLALAALGSAQQARGTAQAAADLGALAAATALRDGFEACEVAHEAVARNHGTLTACVAEGGGVVEVTASRATTGLPGWAVRDAVATARAGPRPGAAVGQQLTNHVEPHPVPPGSGD